MNRPDDSFERRFALEQAVTLVCRRHGDVANSDATRRFTLEVANYFLKFLKDEK